MQVGCFTAFSMKREAGIPADKMKPCAGEGSNGHRVQMLPAGTEVEGGDGPYAPMGYPQHLLRLAAVLGRARPEERLHEA